MAGVVVVAFAWGFGILLGASWLAPVMLGGVALLLPGIMLLGAAGAGARSHLVVFAALYLGATIAAGLGLPFLLAGTTAASRIVLGLPLIVAVEVYGVAVLPALVLPFVFARDFASRSAPPAPLLNRE